MVVLETLPVHHHLKATTVETVGINLAVVVVVLRP